MRRGLLIVLVLALSLSAVPASADGLSGWDLSLVASWWSNLGSQLSEKLTNTSEASDSGETLPVLDPDGLTAEIPSSDFTRPGLTRLTSASDDGNTLPVLDPDG